MSSLRTFLIGTEDVEIRFVAGTGAIIVPLVTRFVDFRRMESGIEGFKVELLSLGSLIWFDWGADQNV